MSDPLPPKSALEEAFYKLTFALTGIRTLLTELKVLVVAMSLKQETGEKKIEALKEHFHSLQSDFLIVAKDLAHLIEIEKLEHRTLEEMRSSLTAQQMKFADVAHDVEEAREDLHHLTPVRGVPLPTQEELNAQTARREKESDDDPKKIFGAVVVIGKAVKTHWPKISLGTTGALLLHTGWAKLAAVWHAIIGLFGG